MVIAWVEANQSRGVCCLDLISNQLLDAEIVSHRRRLQHQSHQRSDRGPLLNLLHDKGTERGKFSDRDFVPSSPNEQSAWRYELAGPIQGWVL